MKTKKSNTTFIKQRTEKEWRLRIIVYDYLVEISSTSCLPNVPEELVISWFDFRKFIQVTEFVD